MMSTLRTYVHRLYTDSTVLVSLHPSQVEHVMNWAEGKAQECTSETTFERLLADLRLLNRYVAQGGNFNEIFTMIRRTDEWSRLPFFPSQSEVLSPVARFY